MIITLKNIFSLLTKKDKFNFFVLCVFILLNTLLELISLGLIIPAISIIFNPEMVPEYFLQIEIISKYLIDKNYFIYTLFFILFVYYLKNILITLIHIFQTNYLFSLQKRLSENIFLKFLKNNITFHIKNSKAKLIQIIIGEVNNFVGRVVLPIIILITEFLIFFGILLIVFLNEFNITYLIFFSFLIFLTYYLFFKNKISKWGEDRKIGESNRIKSVEQSLSFVKEIKLFNKINFFFDDYVKENLKSIFASKKLTYIQIIPRVLTELLIVTFLILFLIFNLEINTSSQKIISSLAIFAAASFRIMPSINRIMMAIQNLRFGIPIIFPVKSSYDKKINYYNNLPKTRDDKFIFKQIEFSNVSFSYNKKQTIFKKLNFRIKSKEFIGIVGSSGSGKTTLLNLIIGFLQPNSGNIYKNKKKFNLKKIRQWHKIIGYIPQRVYLIDDTLINNIKLNRSKNVNLKKLKKSLKGSELEKEIIKKKVFLNKKIGENGSLLSEGQRQRLAIARALYHDRQILILDEATSSLDKENEKKIFQTISKLKKDKTIIMVTHNTNNLKMFDRVISVKDKKIYIKNNKQII